MELLVYVKNNLLKALSQFKEVSQYKMFTLPISNLKYSARTVFTLY